MKENELSRSKGDDRPILISGFGSIGRRHLYNLQKLGYENIILYRTGKSLLPKEELEKLPTEYDLASALTRCPKAAIISNPTALHLDVALPAARAGCHLLIEKPVSHSLKGLDDLKVIVQEKNLQVLVGFQFRFHPGLRAIKQLLDDGVIGKVIYAHAHWGEYLPDWHPWEDYRQSYSARSDLGGGVVLTLCHPFDYLRWLLGEVEAVSAMAVNLESLETDVEDTSNVTLRFRSGVIGMVHLDYVQRPPSHTLHLTGNKGLIKWDYSDGTVYYYLSETDEWNTIPVPQDFERNTMFLDEMRHFMDCVEGRTESLITLDDGIRALEIALAAKQAAAEERVIEIGDKTFS
jgi:predicted dehydrogenase